MNDINLAVILTCHNRVNSTMACLESLFSQSMDSDINIYLYLFDDGSTDGTSETVQSVYPSSVILKGDGSYYWNRGMRCAFARAMEVGHDYYLLLNDDTILYPHAFCALFDTIKEVSIHKNLPAIIVGAIRDPLTNVITYGGINLCKNDFDFEVVPIGTEPMECDTFNCNCLLIAKQISLDVGNLDSVFTHHWGDLDYGLRAKKMGYQTWTTSVFVGECSRNSIGGTWHDKNLPYFARLRKIISPKGLPPLEYFVFTRRHAPSNWFFYWLIPYINLFIGRR